ncbi:MAG: hypothetical protein ACYS7Y_11890 [Planctomycetota bacterium]|jgi:hypothetical protein
MKTTISQTAIDKLVRKLNYLRFGCGLVMLGQMTVSTPTPRIRKFLAEYDETGRLAAQVKQALLQGAI